MKEILCQLLADAEARSLVSNSFPKIHINDKINVSVKAMCRVAAKKLLNKALQICREHAGHCRLFASSCKISAKYGTQ